MKKIFLIAFILLQFIDSEAQVVEVNPNIKWSYVRSQELDLQNEGVYKYEFPAERGYDYIFNLFYSEIDFISYIKVYDIQMKPIHSEVDSSSRVETHLGFRVQKSGTYYVVFGFQQKDQEIPKLSTQFTLVRRPIVE
ncbi:MAG: hypothetical protein HKP14_04680 [Bacteroidia bacterium]|nr:hypothetical protein [Bacteroidia bacterium]